LAPRKGRYDTEKEAEAKEVTRKAPSALQRYQREKLNCLISQQGTQTVSAMKQKEGERECGIPSNVGIRKFDE